ncbi:MAG: hypothetical protein JSW10_07155, partial [Pseudomonadota bacterium]
MAPASAEAVRGNFDNAEFEYGGITSRFYRRDGRYFVHTEGPGGEMAEFEIQYTFGYEPLQQYLVSLPGGRLQALSTAWDVEQQRWFFLYPGQTIAADDWLHWTRNGQNWNGMCAECHSTNLIKGYDPKTNSYATTWSEIDVSCEACHGPGSRHVAWAGSSLTTQADSENYGLLVRTSGIDNRQQVELCAPCHTRRSELGDYDHTQRELLDTFLPALLRADLYHVDGQILEEDYVWGSFVQSKMYHSGTRCGDCHDVHSLKLHKPGNALCTRCHQPDVYDAASHHFHQELAQGKPNSGALCVKCHMPEQPFMVIDYRADHSLRVPRPDLSAALGVPNACSQSGCHSDKPIEWVLDAYTKWYGKARKPHFATILADGRAGAPDARDGLIKMVENPLYPAIVRATALAELQAYPGEASARTIQRALSDKEALVRHTAVDNLALTDASQMAVLLAPLLVDPVRAVRLSAAARLAQLPALSLQPDQRTAFEQALADYVRSMERSLDFSFAGMNLGNLYSAQGEFEKAEHYYRSAIGVDDRFSPVKMNLAVLL